MPEMRSVFSSHINAIGYEEATGELHVQFKNGSAGIYDGVPPEIAAKVNASASIGSALHELVKPNYPFRYV